MGDFELNNPHYADLHDDRSRAGSAVVGVTSLVPDTDIPIASASVIDDDNDHMEFIMNDPRVLESQSITAGGRPLSQARPVSIASHSIVSGNHEAHLDEAGNLTARRPDQPVKQYLRSMSSFAAWQVSKEKKGGCFGEAKRAYFCWTMLILCTLVFVVEMAVADFELEPFTVNPTFGPKVEVLLLLGAKRTDLILAGDWFRLILPMFLHGGIIHLVFNMLGLINIGFPMEHESGTGRVMYIYLTSGFLGIIFSAIFVPDVVGVGASGAIFGLFGAAWADLIQNWSIYYNQGVAKRMLVQLLFATVLNLGLGLMPVLDNFAHVGGFITGFMTGLTVLVQDRYTRFGEHKGKKFYQAALQVCSFIATPIAILSGIVVLYFGIDVANYCGWCHSISCYPMPPGVDPADLWWGCDDCASDSLSGNVATNGTIFFTCPGTTQRIVSDVSAVGLVDPTAVDTSHLITLCRENCI